MPSLGELYNPRRPYDQKTTVNPFDDFIAVFQKITSIISPPKTEDIELKVLTKPIINKNQETPTNSKPIEIFNPNSPQPR